MVYNKPLDVLWVTTMNTYSVTGMLTQRNVSSNRLILKKKGMQNALSKFHLRNYNYFTEWNVDQLQLPSEKPILTQCPQEKLSP